MKKDERKKKTTILQKISKKQKTNRLKTKQKCKREEICVPFNLRKNKNYYYLYLYIIIGGF